MRDAEQKLREMKKHFSAREETGMGPATIDGKWQISKVADEFKAQLGMTNEVKGLQIEWQNPDGAKTFPLTKNASGQFVIYAGEPQEGTCVGIERDKLTWDFPNICGIVEWSRVTEPSQLAANMERCI